MFPASGCACQWTHHPNVLRSLANVNNILTTEHVFCQKCWRNAEKLDARNLIFSLYLPRNLLIKKSSVFSPSLLALLLFKSDLLEVVIVLPCHWYRWTEKVVIEFIKKHHDVSTAHENGYVRHIDIYAPLYTNVFFICRIEFLLLKWLKIKSFFLISPWGWINWIAMICSSDF